MIKRTLEISAEPAHVSVKHRQIVLSREGQMLGAVPSEDLGLLVVDQPAVTYTHGALVALLESDGAVVLCGGDHLPLGMLLPLGRHAEIVSRLHVQVRAPLPLKKRLWKQIVRAKVRAQADNLTPGSRPWKLLRHLERRVRSGDPANVEARAARAYWQVWLTHPDGGEPPVEFRRARDGATPNALLNYGYAILRAALARALVAAGLHPAFGVHHSHRANAFCLADDLLEPLRPLVDARVRELYFDGCLELDRRAKQALLELLTVTVTAAEQTGPLMVALHRYAASLVKSYEQRIPCLEFPVACTSPDTVPCGSS